MVFHYHKQETEYTCGAAATKMILEHFGVHKTEAQIIKELKTNKKRGTWTKNFSILAEKFNLDYWVKSNSTIKDLKNYQKKGYLLIINYFIPEEKCDHYSVLRKIDSKYIYFIDPWFGPDYKYPLKEFQNLWHSNFNFEKEKRWFIAIKKRENDLTFSITMPHQKWG